MALLSVISVNLVPSFHLSSHEIFKYGIFWASPMFLTAALCVKYYRVQAGREKKKKKGTIPDSRCHEQTRFLTSQKDDSKDFNSMPHLSMSPRAGAELHILTFFGTDTQLCTKYVTSNRLFLIIYWYLSRTM